MTWVHDLTVLKPPQKLKAWLTTTKPLSKSLKQLGSKLTVTILQEKFSTMLSNEQIVFPNNPPPDCWLREVLLCIDTIPYVLGRTVVPLATFANFKQEFLSLNTKLLGEHFIYQNPATSRSTFSFQQISKTHELWPKFSIAANTLWARRSMFNLEGYNLLLTEIFLPAVTQIINLPANLIKTR